MKIAYLCPRYLWAGGGAPYHAKRLAEEMTHRGHRVTLLVDEVDAKNCQLNTPRGCELFMLPRRRVIEERAAKVLQLEKFRGFYRVSKILFGGGYLRLIAQGPYCPIVGNANLYSNYDVVCLVSSSNSCWPVLLRKALSKLDGTVKVAMPLLHPKELSMSWNYFCQLHTDYDCINTSTRYETQLLKHNGLVNKHIEHIGVGADSFDRLIDHKAFRKRYNISTDAPIVLFLGRKIYNKGITHVVQAMDYVWKRMPDVVLALIGYEHNSRAWLQGYINQSRFPESASRTVDLYDVSHAEVEEALTTCNLMVAPSISDSFGIVYLDAWRHCKPVIGCRDTCCESLIEHGRDGILVTFGNVSEVGEAIVHLMTRRDDADQMGKNGYEKWKKYYTWDTIADKTEDLYMRLLAKSK